MSSFQTPYTRRTTVPSAPPSVSGTQAQDYDWAMCAAHWVVYMWDEEVKEQLEILKAEHLKCKRRLDFTDSPQPMKKSFRLVPVEPHPDGEKMMDFLAEP